MVRTGYAWGALAVAAMISATGKPATAEVLDAVYRGTMVCEKLPFTNRQMRESIEVIISGAAASYKHIVRLSDKPVAATEQGTGTVSGQAISLQGAWRDSGREYQSKYSGEFVQRSARLKGTQSWTADGKTVTRNCAGVIKRPLKAFLPRKRG